MNRDEALTVLGIEPTQDLSFAQVRKRYQELYSDYQVRLENAPTPDLKKTYQKNVLDLRDACEFLAPGSVAGTAQDLPSPEPITPVPENSSAVPHPDSHAAIRMRPPLSGTGLSPTTIVVSIIAIIFAAFSAFLLIQWRQTVVLLNAQRVASASAQRSAAPNHENGAGTLLPNPQEEPRTNRVEPTTRPAIIQEVPVLFKGSARDCTLYLDKAKIMVLKAEVLTHASLPSGEHYLECTTPMPPLKHEARWETRVNFGGSQKIVEIGEMTGELEDALAAAVNGTVGVYVSGYRNWYYAANDCTSLGTYEQFGDGERGKISSKETRCGRVEVTLTDNRVIYINPGSLRFTDRGGRELPIGGSSGGNFGKKGKKKATSSEL